MKNILIGTISGGNKRTIDYLNFLGKYGFECTEITFGHDPDILREINPDDFAGQVVETLKKNNMELSCLGIYGNPLESDEESKKTLKGWEVLIDNAHKFGTDLICGFTGRIIGKPIPESIPQFKAVFSDLAARAKEKGVRIAFENCSMGGTWATGGYNIAVNPCAWEMMFEAVSSDNLGLEWEPAHQMHQLIDPIAQLRVWAPRVMHVHGKDATIEHDTIAKYGILGSKHPIYDRTPGFGDTNWTNVISILRANGYKGNIDIEGWHDKVYGKDLEMTGQVHALNYLRQCRGGKLADNFIW